MPKSDFIPTRDSAFLVWHDQYKTGVIAQAATVGLVAADTTAVTADNTDIHAKITASVAADASAKQATLNKQVSRETIVARVRAMARRIKAHPAYTPAIGAQLGIVGPEDTTNLTTSKPDLSGDDQTGGNVELQFNKSISDGVNIYSQRDGDAGFVFLARDTASPYVDNRPLLVAGKPEMRNYKAKYVSNDAEIGLFSNELVVTCQP